MKCPPVFADESERLAALAEYGLHPERPLQSLDAVVQIAMRMFDMPVAAVNMIGNQHVFLAASRGIDAGNTDMRRDVSFCAHAIAGDDVMVVHDATRDERFHDNPLVTGPTRLRFYAGAPLRSPGGKSLGALCVIDDRARHDFTEADAARLADLARMASARLELRRLEVSTEVVHEPLKEYAPNSPTAVVGFDPTGRILAWNKAAAALFGHEFTDQRGRLLASLLAEASRVPVMDIIELAATIGSVDSLCVPDTVRGLRGDGTEFDLGMSLFCWCDDGRMVFNAHFQDVTSRQRKEQELEYLATTDVLTGLPNRASFYRRAQECLLQSPTATLLLIDLDGFKDINDTLGSRVGDQVLRDIGERLRSMVGAEHLVARTSGDEYTLLLPGVGSGAEATRWARRVIEAIAAPLLVDGHDVHVAGSCGVAIAPDHAHELLALTGNADLALFKAKSLGRGQACLFAESLRTEATTRRLYNMELHRAVHDGEFVLFYQPQVTLADGALVGAEALLRWRHPRRGLLSPAAFLEALENGPLAAVAGYWVLDEACAQAATWRRHGAANLRMGVNLFSAQFRSGDLLAQVTATLDRHGLPPDALELEITETIVLDNDELVLESLQDLRRRGVGIAFDDFGTGYASLSLLKRYPLTRIKIDRSFVQNMIASRQDASLVRSILDMAGNFDLHTIAEGVEEQAQHDTLRQLGCHEGQGYLFGKPAAAADFEAQFGIGRGARKPNPDGAVPRTSRRKRGAEPASRMPG